MDKAASQPTRQPPSWFATLAARYFPFEELTQEQQLQKAKHEARARAGTLRGLPSVFGELA